MLLQHVADLTSEGPLVLFGIDPEDTDEVIVGSEPDVVAFHVCALFLVWVID